jgi:hypothetical protein
MFGECKGRIGNNYSGGRFMLLLVREGYRSRRRLYVKKYPIMAKNFIVTV